MYGAGKKLLARAAGALDKHIGGACGDLRQYVEKPSHGGALADDVLETVAPVQLFLQAFELAEVLKAFHPADDPAFRVLQQGAAQAYGDALAFAVNNQGLLVQYRLAAGKGLAQGAIILADTGAKDLRAPGAYGFLARDAGDLFGGPVEAGDAPVQVHAEHAFVQRIEYGAVLVQVKCGFGLTHMKMAS